MTTLIGARTQSRAKFVVQMAGASLLASCSGSFSTIGSGPIDALMASSSLQALMSRYNILAISQDGKTIVRSDMLSNAAFMGTVRPYDCTYTGIRGTSHAADGCGGQGDPTSTTTTAPPSAGLSTIASVTCYANQYPTWDSFYLIASPVPAFGGDTYVGPTYTVSGPPNNCVAQTLATVGDQLKGLAEGIIAGLTVNGSLFTAPPMLLKSAAGVVAGSVSIAGFTDVLLAVVAASDLPAILAAGGVVVGLDLIYQFIRCEMAS